MGLTPGEIWGGDEPPRAENESARHTAERKKAPQIETHPLPPSTSAPPEKLFPANLADGISRDTQATLIIVLLMICTIFLAWHTFKPAQKWEYKTVAVPDYLHETQMGNLGQEGWELVFARRATSTSLGETEKPEFSYEMIFKRPAR
ncbi:MAG TPA: hypothetical protein VE732_04425 [Nitrososphaera sp.]|nr:hypothetical protein [Nitrososphaera sp.]